MELYIAVCVTLLIGLVGINILTTIYHIKFTDSILTNHFDLITKILQKALSFFDK